jgi:hypothetical protein
LPVTKTGFKAELILNHGFFGDLPAEYSETIKRINDVMEYEYEK